MDNKYEVDNIVILNKFLNLDFDKKLNDNSNVLIDFYNVYCNYIKFNKYSTFTNYSFKCLLKHVLEFFKECKNVIIVSKEIYESEGEEYITDIVKNYSNTVYYIVKDKDKKNSGKNRERDDFYLIYKYFLFSNDSKDTYIVSNDKFKNYMSIINNAKCLNVKKISKEQCLDIEVDDFELNNIKSLLVCKNKDNINKINCSFIIK